MKRFGRQTAWQLGVWLIAVAVAIGARDASAARIKDIAVLQGLQSSQLIGYGLVTGLNRTGDRTTSVNVTRQSLENLLRNMGITLNDFRGRLRTENVAAVLVTADVPAFMRAGSRFDVTVSSIGDARSLEGGTLQLTNLMDPEGNVVATAAGPISTGGFLVESFGERVQKNHVTVGRIPNGGLVQVDIGSESIVQTDPNAADPATAERWIVFGLQNPDFTTAARMADTINAALGANTATPLDAASVRVTVPANTTNLVQYIAQIEALDVEPDQRARIIVDERTGTVVMGENVRISEVAVTHGNLSVSVFTRPVISQPSPFSEGETIVVPDSEIVVEEPVPSLHEGGPIQLLPSGTSLNELIQALNALGVGPRDLISILQLIKRSGALQAELEIM